MVEPHDWPVQAEELGLQACVVSDENTSTIQDAIRRFYELNSQISHLGRLPEGLQCRVLWMGVADDGPTFVTPASNGFGEILKVVRERRGCFWNAGKLCIPVERDGNSSWVTLTPVATVPGVQSWAACDDGGLVRVHSLPPRFHFVVGTDEPDCVAMLRATGVEGPGTGFHTYIRLTCAMFDIDDSVADEPLDIGVPSDHENVIRAHNHVTFFPEEYIPLATVRERFPDLK